MGPPSLEWWKLWNFDVKTVVGEGGGEVFKSTKSMYIGLVYRQDLSHLSILGKYM